MKDNVKEIWRRIDGYEGLYEVSNWGRVRSVERLQKYRKKNKVFIRKKQKRILKNNVTFYGYGEVSLYKNGKVIKRAMVHRLVAQTFIKNPLKKTQINHIDCNKLNNYVENLEWCTPSENIKHSIENNLHVDNSGELNGMSKLTKLEVSKIKKIYSKRALKQKEIANMYNVSPSLISLITSGKRW